MGELSKRKTGGKERRFTRVSGVLFLLEHLQPTEIKHVAMLIHNPFAAQALPGGLWTGIDDEFGGKMADGHGVNRDSSSLGLLVVSAVLIFALVASGRGTPRGAEPPARPRSAMP